jgi:hypothetical protein
MSLPTDTTSDDAVKVSKTEDILLTNSEEILPDTQTNPPGKIIMIDNTNRLCITHY